MLSVHSGSSSKRASSKGLSNTSSPTTSISPNNSPVLTTTECLQDLAGSSEKKSSRNLILKKIEFKVPNSAPDSNFRFQTGTTEATQQQSNKDIDDSKSTVEILDQSFMSNISNESPKKKIESPNKVTEQPNMLKNVSINAKNGKIAWLTTE